LNGPMTVSFSHLGICVSDVERSLRFYCEALGFEAAEVHHVGNEFGRLMELDDVQVESRFVRGHGMAIELLCYQSPGHIGEPVRRPLNQLGLTHLSVRVDDVDAVAANVVACGGVVLAETRTTFEMGTTTLDFVYCTDPDGIRIELMRLPG
jgi:catechol 2,3-dioxygenase-like lactoylglutathione lyase family enzyme